MTVVERVKTFPDGVLFVCRDRATLRIRGVETPQSCAENGHTYEEMRKIIVRQNEIKPDIRWEEYFAPVDFTDLCARYKAYQKEALYLRRLVERGRK